MILADVFGQTQVMQLARPRVEERGYHGDRSRKMRVPMDGEKRDIQKIKFFSFFSRKVDEVLKGSAATHFWLS